jgi:hypothetical protein
LNFSAYCPKKCGHFARNRGRLTLSSSHQPPIAYAKTKLCFPGNVPRRFADEKGRDAFAFDPIESRYLEAAPATCQIRTPYSRRVVNEIREIPYARWDADRRLWTVPYRSFDALRQ